MNGETGAGFTIMQPSVSLHIPIWLHYVLRNQIAKKTSQNAKNYCIQRVHRPGFSRDRNGMLEIKLHHSIGKSHKPLRLVLCIARALPDMRLGEGSKLVEYVLKKQASYFGALRKEVEPY